METRSQPWRRRQGRAVCVWWGARGCLHIGIQFTCTADWFWCQAGLFSRPPFCFFFFCFLNLLIPTISFSPFSAQCQESPTLFPSLPQVTGQPHTSYFSSHASASFSLKLGQKSVPYSCRNKMNEQSGSAHWSQAGVLVYITSCQENKARAGCLPEAWTSMMYWCKSWPCWMTSKVMLFMASFRSVWRWSRCSASVRSSVLKSFICRSKSSFQASSSAVTCEGTTISPGSLVHERLLNSGVPSLS